MTGNRRAFLRSVAGGVTLSTVGLAGCMGDGGGGGGDYPTDYDELTEHVQDIGEVNILNIATGLEDYWAGLEDEFGITINASRVSAGDILPRSLQEAQSDNVTNDVVTMSRDDYTKEMIQGGVWAEQPDYLQENWPDRIPPAPDDPGGNLPMGWYIIDGHVMLTNEDTVDPDDPPTTIEEMLDYALIFDHSMPQILAALQDVHGEEQGLDYVQQIGEIADVEGSFFSTGQAVGAGDYDMCPSLSKYTTYDWGQNLFINEPLQQEFPRISYVAYAGVAEGAPNPGAGEWVLRTTWRDRGRGGDYGSLVNFMNETLGDFHRPTSMMWNEELENQDAMYIWDLMSTYEHDVEQLTQQYREALGAQ